MSLYPTPNRLRLLRAVAAGTVWRYQNHQDYDAEQYKVTAAVSQMERAGWVILGPPQALKSAWMLTAAGRAVLGG